MKRNLLTLLAVVALGLTGLCGTMQADVKCYNRGINIIPMPQQLVATGGEFKLTAGTTIAARSAEARTIAEFFAAKINQSTGYALKVADKGDISLAIDPAMKIGNEGYELCVKPNGVSAKAKTAQGLFYAMQSFLQLLPAEIESPQVAKGVEWTAPAVSIADEPRFGYRGIMLDPCRHFMPGENVKK